MTDRPLPLWKELALTWLLGIGTFFVLCCAIWSCYIIIYFFWAMWLPLP